MYRAGKALADIIPPDRRRLKAAVLVVSSMVAGAAVWAVGSFVLEMGGSETAVPRVSPPTSAYVAGRIAPAVLHGPGATVTLPPKTRAVVNVWLQGCADCMPAFEAMARLMQQNGLGFDAVIINVAYGEADVTWAQRYGVASNLVFDPGGVNVVKPLGIGTFTTLVVEPDGTIIHRDRPDRPGFADRMRVALGEGSPLATDAVQRVVASHTADIRLACWDRGTVGDSLRSSANVTVSLIVAPDGAVSGASATGDDPEVAKCIQARTLTWRFPAPGATTTVSIPFKFVHQ